MSTKQKLLKKLLTYEKNNYRRIRFVEVPVHRVVATIKMRRRLRKGEVVHHINENKLDNRLNNLRVFKSQSAHMKHHWKKKKKKQREK